MPEESMKEPSPGFAGARTPYISKLNEPAGPAQPASSFWKTPQAKQADAQPKGPQEYPKMMYGRHHGRLHCATVANAEEEAIATDRGYVDKPTQAHVEALQHDGCKTGRRTATAGSDLDDPLLVENWDVDDKGNPVVPDKVKLEETRARKAQAKAAAAEAAKQQPPAPPTKPPAEDDDSTT